MEQENASYSCGLGFFFFFLSVKHILVVLVSLKISPLDSSLDPESFRSGKRLPRAAALSPSSGIFLRIPTSWPRSLWGVSFQPAPNPSLVLGARIALAQAGNPRPITDCGSGSRLVPLLRRRTGFLQGGILAPSRPLQSGLRNLRLG